MKLLKQQYDAGQLPPGEFSQEEQHLLETHLDRELVHRWKKIIAQEDAKTTRGRLKKKTMAGIIGLVLVAAIAIMTLRYYAVNRDIQPSKPQPMAMQGVVAYPFSSLHVRSTNAPAAESLAWQEAIQAYRNGNYAQALDKSLQLQEPFLSSMCLLYLGRYEEALRQFDVALTQPDAPIELHYYRGIALRQLDRKEAATLEFELVIDSREARATWKDAAKKELAKLVE